MPAVHSHRVHSERFSSENYSRRGCASMTFYTLAMSSQSTREWGLKKKISKIRGDSQARHETLRLGRHRLLKKWKIMRRDTSAWSYTRASETRRVFPSTFLLLPCLEFSRWECTASIKSSSTDCNESNKPPLMPPAYIGSKKSLVKFEFGVSKNKLFQFFSHFLLYWKVYFFTLSHGFLKPITYYLSESKRNSNWTD